MFTSYWNAVWNSSIDKIILLLGFTLVGLHVFGIYKRHKGRETFFVQEIKSYQQFLLNITELLPLFGLLGTVLGLLNTFSSFQTTSGGDGTEISSMIQSFAPAMSSTISGILMAILNLVLNACLWLYDSKSVQKELN